VRDRGDGSYEVPVSWDPAVTPQPGVIVQQPERGPVVIGPRPGQPPCPPRDCRDAAGKLLDCLGLPCADVKRVRVKRVSLDVDLDTPDHDDCKDTPKPPKPPCNCR
jgi:hypothetical protein